VARADIHLAPAISHMCFSSPTCAKATAKLGVAASKTHLFLCFHRTQAPKIRAEFRPFRAAPVTTTLLFLPQSKKEVSSGCGEIPYITLPKNVNQNCLVNTEEINRWSMVSSS
jgi:hypothetical protein